MELDTDLYLSQARSLLSEAPQNKAKFSFDLNKKMSSALFSLHGSNLLLKGRIYMSKVYVFDLDGTLVDSMPYFERGMLAVADDEGLKYDDETIKLPSLVNAIP